MDVRVRHPYGTDIFDFVYIHDPGGHPQASRTNLSVADVFVRHVCLYPPWMYMLEFYLF